MEKLISIIYSSYIMEKLAISYYYNYSVITITFDLKEVEL